MTLLGRWAISERDGIEQAGFLFDTTNLRALRRRIGPHFISLLVVLDELDRPFLQVAVPDLELPIGIVGPFGDDAISHLTALQSRAATATVVLRETNTVVDLSHFARGLVLDYSGVLDRAMRAARAGRLEEADDFLTGLCARPLVPTGTYYELGRIALARGGWQDALHAHDAELEQCRGTDGQLLPFASFPLNSRGVIFQRLGRAAEARRAFEHALQLRPNYVEALLGLAATLAPAPESRKVVFALLARAAALRPEGQQLTATLGEVAATLNVPRTELQARVDSLRDQVDFAAPAI